jgi:hypothetical protein
LAGYLSKEKFLQMIRAFEKSQALQKQSLITSNQESRDKMVIATLCGMGLEPV